MIYIILIAIAVVALFWQPIKAWMLRRLQRKMERKLREAFGMPPREETGGRQTRSQRRRQRPSGEQRRPDSKKIPNEYGEDVDFVEIKEFEETDIAADRGDGTRTVYHESQVSDAEWEEVK